MGYRSDVIIRCEPKAYAKLKSAWERVNMPPQLVNVDDVGNYTVTWNSIKWYRDFDNVRIIEDTLNDITIIDENASCDSNIQGYGFKRIIIGEDNYTEEKSNPTGNDVFDDFFVLVNVNLPTNQTPVLIN